MFLTDGPIYTHLLYTSPLPFNAFSSPDHFTLSMFNHLKLTELDYPVKSILKRGIMLRAPMCSSYMLPFSTHRCRSGEPPLHLCKQAPCFNKNCSFRAVLLLYLL